MRGGHLCTGTYLVFREFRIVHILWRNYSLKMFQPALSWAIYLIPMLLHAAFRSAGECLRVQRQSWREAHTHTNHRAHKLTFAISAQLFPASRMVFNLCSSAGVHGVFVRLFLAGGGAMELRLGSSELVAIPAGFEGPDIICDDTAGSSKRFLFRWFACAGEVFSGGRSLLVLK